MDFLLSNLGPNKVTVPIQSNAFEQGRAYVKMESYDVPSPLEMFNTVKCRNSRHKKTHMPSNTPSIVALGPDLPQQNKQHFGSETLAIKHNQIIYNVLYTIDPKVSLLRDEQLVKALCQFKHDMAINLEQVQFKKLGFSRKRNADVHDMMKRITMDNTDANLDELCLQYFAKLLTLIIIIFDEKTQTKVLVGDDSHVEASVLYFDRTSSGDVHHNARVTCMADARHAIWNHLMRVKGIQDALQMQDMKVNEVKAIAKTVGLTETQKTDIIQALKALT
jgi:hypothetical protein